MIRIEPHGSSVLSEEQRLQWWGFLAGLLVTLVAFASGISLNRHDLYQMLRMEGDGWGYYQYLPALLGTHHWEHLPWAFVLPNASGLDLFSCGVAILQAPWFLLGHLLAWASGSPMDGYSAPYALSILLGVSVYVGMASSLLFHALRRRFAVNIALAVPLLLFVGTNLFYYTTRQPSMSHAYVYFLFALLHYLVVRNIERPNAWRTAGILVTCSIAMLIRQLHAVVVLFPLLYGVSGVAPLRDRLRWLSQRPWVTVLGAMLALLPWIPQMTYWHYITEDSYFIFPYGYKGEHFDHLADPHLLDVLLGVVNGWWVYTPLMVAACWWTVRMALRGETGGRLLLLLLVLVWYTYAAWWCWWLGGAFGHRGFVEFYAFLSVPLAWGLERLSRRHWSMRAVAALLLTVAVVANLRFTVVYEWAWSQEGWTWARLAAQWKALL